MLRRATFALNRRHLDRDQLKEIAVDLRRRGAYWTLAKVGEALGVAHETIRRWVPESTFTNVKVDEPVKTTGKDGKRRRHE